MNSDNLENGWIKLYRSSLKNGWLRNHKLWAFWCWCLLKATHTEHAQVVGYQQIKLSPGQFIFGREKAAKELNMSEQNIKTCMATLKKLKNLTTKPTNKFTVISIVNLDSYQQRNEENNQQPKQQVTNDSPTTNHKQECKELKNVKNDLKKKDIRVAERVPPTPPLSFEDFIGKRKSIPDQERSKAIQYFLGKYARTIKDQHPRLKADQWEKVIECIFDVEGDGNAIDLDECRFLIDKYFRNTKRYQEGCNYSLIHFNSFGVKKNLYHEELY